MAKVELKYIFEDEFELVEFNARRLQESNDSSTLSDLENWLRGIRKHGDTETMVKEVKKKQIKDNPSGGTDSDCRLMLEIIIEEFFKIKAENNT